MGKLLSPIAFRDLPQAFRLTDLTMTPLDRGGYRMEATLFHEEVRIEVAWKVKHPETRLHPGVLVSPRCHGGTYFGDGVTAIARVVLLDYPIRTLDLFKTVPDSWVPDRALLERAGHLWELLPLPWQELFNNVLWDAKRFHLVCVGPSSISGHHSETNGNLRHMVETGEAACALLPRYPTAHPDISLFAALMHDVGKAVEYEPNSSGGWKMTDQGKLNGHKQIVGDWLSVANSRLRLGIPPEHYDSMRHAIGSTKGVKLESGYREPRTPEARLVSLADQTSGSNDLFNRQARKEPGWGEAHPHLGGMEPYLVVGRTESDSTRSAEP
jgi:3'-5' exoribonuclease